MRVFYPPEQERVTHFDSVRDPARIVKRVVETLIATRGVRRAPQASAGAFAKAPAPSQPAGRISAVPPSNGASARRAPADANAP